MSIFSPQSWRREGATHVTLDQQLVGSVSRKRTISFRQFKYLKRILTRREYRLVQVLSIILIINILFLSWKSYHALTIEVPRSGGMYSEGLIGAPSTINPLFLGTNDSDRDLASLIYSGLMRYTSDRRLAEDLAEKVTISDDQKTYTFHLRNGVTWHDGETFDADDVLFTITKIQDPATKSPLFASYKDIAVKKIDEQTVSFTLSKPFAPFLDLATVAILPEHLWQELTSEQLALSVLNLKPIGTGPWKFRSLQKDKDGTIRSYTLLKNNEYYGQRPFIEKLVFKFYPDMESAVQGLKNRHVQGVSFIPKQEREELSADADLARVRLHLPQYTALFVNTAGKKELQSREVRKALAHALNKEKLVAEGLGGEGQVIHAPLLSGMLGYHPAVAQFVPDPARAEELLDAAGLKKDAIGNRPLTIELVTVDIPENVRIAEMIQEMWQALGITVVLTNEPQGTMKELVLNPRKYDILLYGAVIGSDPDLYPFWHSSQKNAPGLNLSQFSNTDADALLEKAREIPDPEKRGALYKKFQDILADDVPAFFLYTRTHTALMRKDIKGVPGDRTIVYPADRFADLSQWYIKSRRTLK